MAVIDIKNCYIRLTDGRLGVLTTSVSPVDANAVVVFTGVSKHRGSRPPITVAFVDPGANNAALSVVVTDSAIVVNLATGPGGAITSTAAQIAAAILASGAASALVTAVAGGTGAGVVQAFAASPLLLGARTLAIKVGEGTLTWDETKNRVYQNDRGLLDAVKNGDEAPVDLKFDFAYEFLKAVTSSGVPTVRDAFYNEGEASAWVTTASDPCEPYQLDVELENAPPCAGVLREFTMFERFLVEDLTFDPKESKVSVSGKSHVVMPVSYRVA